MAVDAIGNITNVLPAVGAGTRPHPQPTQPDAVPPEEIRTVDTKDLNVVSFSREAPASIEVPMNQILDSAVHGNTPIGTLDQLRSDNPEDFLTLIMKVLRSSGTGTASVRAYESYAASQMTSAATTTEAPIGASLDVAA